LHRYLPLALKYQNSENDKLYTIQLKKIWTRFCKFYKLDVEHWTDGGSKAIETIVEKFKKEFGNFEVLAIEERLELPNGGEWPQNFKGFIDVIIKTESGKIIIIDFKTCNSHFMFNKFRDKYKDYQLTLYKKFYCIKHNLDPKDIETYFVTIERRKKAKEPLELTRVSGGSVKLNNASEWLETALRAINRETWLHKRSSCFKFGEDHPCSFYKSEYCK